MTHDEYWRGFEIMFDRTDTAPFVAARGVPEPCLPCAYRAACAGRRCPLDQPAEPGLYCPVIRTALARDLARAQSACTTIVMAR